MVCDFFVALVPNERESWSNWRLAVRTLRNTRLCAFSFFLFFFFYFNRCMQTPLTCEECAHQSKGTMQSIEMDLLWKKMNSCESYMRFTSYRAAVKINSKCVSSPSEISSALAGSEKARAGVAHVKYLNKKKLAPACFSTGQQNNKDLSQVPSSGSYQSLTRVPLIKQHVSQCSKADRRWHFTSQMSNARRYSSCFVHVKCIQYESAIREEVQQCLSGQHVE